MRIYLLFLFISVAWSCGQKPHSDKTEGDFVDYYLYILQPIDAMKDSANWNQQAQATYQAHLEYIKELYKTKKAVILSRAALPQYDKDFFTLCFLKTYQKAEAEALAFNDPAVLSGLMTVKLIPVVLVKK